jgi:hypothetical protein
VEIVPLSSHPPTLSYCDGAGITVAQFDGHLDCDAYETVGPINLGGYLAPGDTYVVRIMQVSAPQNAVHSSHFRRIRVVPVQSSSVSEHPAATTWSHAKEIYR